jgi:hypothetical protein
MIPRTTTTTNRPARTLRHAVALVLAAAVLALPLAFAAEPIGVDATAVPFADLDPSDAYLVGVDLALEDGQLVLVFSAGGEGALGDAIVPAADPDGYPVNALGDVVIDEALVRSELVVAEPGGFTFVQDGADVIDTATAYARALAELGFEVAHETGARIVDFGHGGDAYRATFGVVDGGVRVYLGAL